MEKPLRTGIFRDWAKRLFIRNLAAISQHKKSIPSKSTLAIEQENNRTVGASRGTPFGIDT